MEVILSSTTFRLNSVGVVISGSGKNTYSYQITGTGTATIQGSNDNENWIDIATALAAPNSLVVIHSWKYLRSTGTANVLVSRA